VLKDISLSYFFGAKIGVLGLNASGKSSHRKIGKKEEADKLEERAGRISSIQ